MTTCIVTGAAGHLGSTILRQLAGSDWDVRALLFFGETPKVEAENIHYYHGDVTDRSTLKSLFSGIRGEETFVIHTAAIISIQRAISKAIYRTNVIGVRNIVTECIRHHVKRLVHVSSVHAIPELPRGTVQEEITDFDPDLVRGGYAKTKAMGARIVMESVPKLDAVIVLPSGIIGPYDEGHNHLVQMTKEYLLGRLPVCVEGGYDFVDVRDVAAGAIRACTRAVRGETYLLTGHYLPIGKLLAMEGKIAGKKPLPVLPLPLAAAGLPFVSLYCHAAKIRPLYTAYSLQTLKSNGFFSSKKARKALGFSSRSPQKTVRDMVLWLQGKPLP